MIAASRCPACGRADVPPTERCPACRAATGEDEVAPEGRVLAATRPAGADAWVALVALDAGARVLARADERPALGAACRVEPDGEGFRVRPEG